MEVYIFLFATLLLLIAIYRHFRSREARELSLASNFLAGRGDYDFEIVGEASYQENLARIAGTSPDGVEHYCEAVLEHQPWNIHDANAVRVKISGLTVGYIRRREAPLVKKLLGHGGAAHCSAVIVGGWNHGALDQGHYGVKLDVVWPLRF